MFVLTVLRDVVRVAPEKFERPLLEVLAEELDKKYSNKVLVDVGLCICVNDFKTVEEAIIYPSDGGAHHRVVFRVIVFRPFIGEIAVGTISGADENGIKVSLDFFEDVFIPSYLLPQPSEYDPRAKVWVWKYEGSEEGGIFHTHEVIRFRVESVSYTQVEFTTAAGERRVTTNLTEQTSSSPGGVGGGNDGKDSLPGPPKVGLRQRSTSIDLGKEDTSTDPPVMQITASVNEHGLGLVAWKWE